MKAGETKTIILEMDLSNDALPKDWSLVAWGESAGVKVEHTDGSTSDKFPTLAGGSQLQGGSPVPVPPPPAPVDPASFSAEEQAFRAKVESLSVEGSQCSLKLKDQYGDNGGYLTTVYFEGPCKYAVWSISQSESDWANVVFDYEGSKPKECSTSAGQTTCKLFIDEKNPRAAWLNRPGDYGWLGYSASYSY